MQELTNGAKPFKSHLELARRVKGVTVDEISMSLGWGWGWLALGGGAIVNSLLPYSVHEIQLHREFQTFSRTLKLTWPAPLREIILVLTVTVGHFINNPSQDDRPGQGPSLSEMCVRIMGVVAVTASVGIGTTCACMEIPRGWDYGAND